jgi:hypothetical protein
MKQQRKQADLDRDVQPEDRFSAHHHDATPTRCLALTVSNTIDVTRDGRPPGSVASGRLRIEKTMTLHLPKRASL